MKQMARPLAGYLMLIILFGVSTGFRVFSHICLMSGERAVTAQEEMSDCCAKEFPAAPFTLRSNCCIEEAYFIKLDYTGSTQEVLSAKLPAETSPLIDLHPALAESVVLTGALLSLPPPRIATDRQATICVFRI